MAAISYDRIVLGLYVMFPAPWALIEGTTDVLIWQTVQCSLLFSLQFSYCFEATLGPFQFELYFGEHSNVTVD